MQAGTVLSQRYRIDGKLGEGGMGVVFRAHDTLLNRPVAVKSLTPTLLGPDGLARLLREAQAAAQLTHPNIVGVYDVIEAGDSRLIVMEYVEGRTLADLIPMDVPRALEILTQVCQALRYAHGRGIIHRDIKPENIIVTAEGAAKVMDFGLARSEGRTRLTQTGLIVGTVAYMAPEQILGGTVDRRTDLYSLGCVAYELLTGRRPFEADDAFTVLGQHINVIPVAPRWHNPAVPPTLDAMIMRLLAKDPDERYASADDVISALELVGQEETETEDQPAGLATRTTLLERIVRGKLVGREQEVRDLREHLDRMLSGEGRLVMVSGEPGIGKTRLAEELTLYAHLRGAWVLRGHSYEQDVAVPYLTFIESLGALHRLSGDGFLNELGDQAEDIARLLPEIRRTQTTAAVLTPEDERTRIFDAITNWIALVSRRHSLVFILDDLHWADRASLRLLTHLARNLRSERVLILGTYREVELDLQHPLNDTLSQLNRERLLHRLPLRRLSEVHTQRMLAGMFDEELAHNLGTAVYLETDGNPFFIEEVVKTLVEEGKVYREDGRWRSLTAAELEIPQSVRTVIGRRLQKATETTGRMLTFAAVIGREFDPDVLMRVARLGEEEVLDALDEAVRMQLIHERTGDRQTGYVFEHALVRQALYEGLNQRRRVRLHQQVGEALEAEYGRRLHDHIEELAYHFGEAGHLMPAKGIEYNIQAARKAAGMYAMEEAERRLTVALEIVDSQEEPQLRVHVLETLGDVYMQFGERQRAGDAYQRAADALRAGGDTTSEHLLRLHCRIAEANATWAAERRPEALTYVQSVVDQLTDRPDSALKSRALSLLSIHLLRAGKLDAARERAKEATALANRLQDSQEISTAYRAMAMVHRYANEWHLLREVVERQWAMAGAAMTAQDADLFVDLIQSYLMSGNPAEAARMGRRYLELAEKCKSPPQIFRANVMLSSALFLSNNWPEALPLAERALQLLRSLDAHRFTGISLSAIGTLFAAHDEPRARELFPLLAAMPSATDYEHIGPRASAMAIALVLRDTELVRSILPQFEEERPRCLTCGFIFHLWIGQARLSLGDIEGARAKIADAEQLDPGRTVYMVPGGVAYLRALVARASGELEEAARHMEDALQAMSGRPLDFLQAMRREEAGRIYVARGTPDDRMRGQRLLLEALNVYQSLGATRYENRIKEMVAE